MPTGGRVRLPAHAGRRAILLSIALCLAAPVASAGAAGGTLTQLSGDQGCFKGTVRPSMPCAPIVFGQFDASSITVSPDGKFAYVVSPYSGRTATSDTIPGGTITAFRRNTTTGALTQLAGAAGCIKDRKAPANAVTNPCQVKAIGLAGAKTITISRDGRHVYVASINNSAIAAFARNATTGALTQLPGADACIQDVRFPYDECPREVVGMAGVRWLAVSPDGRNVYASAPTSDGIVGLTRNTTTGGLTARQCIKDTRARGNDCPSTAIGVNHPRALALSPDGSSLYVAADSADAQNSDAGNGDAVSAFRRDTTTGLLTQLPGAAACIKDRIARSINACPTVGRGLLDAFHVTVSPDGRNVYVGSHASKVGAIAIFDRNTTSGALTQPAGPAGCFGNSLDCAPARGIGGVDAVTISPDGANAYVTGFYGMSVALFSRNTTTGRLAQLAGQPCIEDPGSSGKADCPVVGRGLNGPRTFTLSPDGRSVYLPSTSGGTIATYTR